MAKVKEPFATYIVDGKGKKTSVILPIERYEELLEDLEDLAVIASRKSEPTYDWKDLKKKLKKDGKGDPKNSERVYRYHCNA